MLRGAACSPAGGLLGPGKDISAAFLGERGVP